MGRLVRNAERHRRLPAGCSYRCGSAAELPGGTADFPATVLYESSGAASLITQLTLWTTLGVLLGELLHRLQRLTATHVAEPDYGAVSLT